MREGLTPQPSQSDTRNHFPGLLETIGRPQPDHHSYNSLRWTSEIELNPAATVAVASAAAPTKQLASSTSKQSKRKVSPSSAMVSMAARLLSETRIRSGKDKVKDASNKTISMCVHVRNASNSSSTFLQRSVTSVLKLLSSFNQKINPLQALTRPSSASPS